MGKRRKRKIHKVSSTPPIPNINKESLKTATVNVTRLGTCSRDPDLNSNVGENSESETRVRKAKAKTKCLICARELNSELPVPQDDLITIRLLCQLFKILKLSTNICRFLVGTSLPSVVYCSSCEEVVSNCVKTLGEIERLRNSFEELTSKVKEGFIEGYYCRPDIDDSGDEKAKAGAHIRKTLVQCWTTCRVPVIKLRANTPNEVNHVAKSLAVETNSDSQVGVDSEEFTPPTPDVYDDGNDNEDCGEIPRSPSPVRSDHESTNIIDVDQLSVALQSQPHVERAPVPGISFGLNTEEIVVEQKGKSSPRRSLRRRPQKKPRFVIRIDDSASETDLIAPVEAEAESDVEVQDVVETHEDSPRIVKRKSKKSHGNIFQENSDFQQIPHSSDRLDLRVNIAGVDSSWNNNDGEETRADNGELRSTTSDINDDENDNDDCGEVPRSPSPVLSDHESSDVDPLIDKAQPQESNQSTKKTEAENERAPKHMDFRTDEVAETEETSSCSRHLRQRPQKRPTYIIESDENASETGSIYSPEAERDCEVDFVEARKDSSKIGKQKLKKSRGNKLPQTTSTPLQLKQFPYNCKICNHGYFSQHYLSLHEQTHIQGDLEYACTKCDKSFNTHFRLACHYASRHKMRMATQKDPSAPLESFHCTYCDRVYKSETFKIEAGSDKLKIPCDQAGCEKMFYNFLIFSYHHDRTCLDKLELIAEDKSNDQGKKGMIRTFSSKPKVSIIQVPKKRHLGVSRSKRFGTTKTSVDTLETKLPAGTNASLHPYRCDVCGKYMMHLYQFLLHQNTHRGEFDHSCTKCDRKFISSFGLHLHYRNGHKVKVDLPYSTHACRSCDKVFDVEFVDGTDSEKSGYRCTFKDCKYIATTRLQYRMHHRNHHRRVNKEKPEKPVSLRCKFCKKDYIYEEVASSGEDGKVVFKCTFDENCKEICPSMQALSVHHMRVHHNVNSRMKICRQVKVKVCKTCGKVFTSSRSFEDHMISAHTKEFKYYCEICGKGCPSSTKLNAHLKTHSTERHFKCKQCPKAYKERFLLNYHMNKHNGITPYVCEFCGKAFHNRNSLSMHKHSAHKEEMKKNK